jgi:8-oxo-dGTP pyrophosphatase MutT (NUDIX family)
MNPITHFVVGTVVVIERDGKVLALKRAANETAAPGAWELPAGKVELDESPYAAACREVVEECGIRADLEPRPLDAIQTTRNGAPMILIFYRARYRSGEVVLSEEHEEFAWLTPAAFAARTSFASLCPVVGNALARSDGQGT